MGSMRCSDFVIVVAGLWIFAPPLCASSGVASFRTGTEIGYTRSMRILVTNYEAFTAEQSWPADWPHRLQPGRIVAPDVEMYSADTHYLIASVDSTSGRHSRLRSVPVTVRTPCWV